MVKTVRGLERGIQVLQALQAQPISALHDIHVATKLPKPTLLRILHTLEQSGLVMRRLATAAIECARPRLAWCENVTGMIASPRPPRRCSIGFAKKSRGRRT